MTLSKKMINLSQDILPKEFNRFCIDCRHCRDEAKCKKCLDWDTRKRPLWELKVDLKLKKAIKQVAKEIDEMDDEEFHKQLDKHANGDIAKALLETKTLEKPRFKRRLSGFDL